MKKKENNKKALKWIYKRTKRYLPLVGVISVTSALISLSAVALALVTKSVLDVATGDAEGSIASYGILLFAVVILQVLLYAVDSVTDTYATEKMRMALRGYLFESLCRRRYSEISGYHSGDILNRFTSDADVIVNAAVAVIPDIVSIATKLIAGLGAMLIINARIALAVLILGAAVPAAGRIINKKYKYLHKECQKTEGATRSFLQECFENIVVIKTFVSETPFVKKLNGYMNKSFKVKMKRTGFSVFSWLSLYAFFTAGYYAVLLWGAGGIAASTLTVGTLTAFLQLFSQLRAPLQGVSGIIPQYYQAIASAERLIELEDKPEECAPLPEDRLEALKKDFASLNVNNVSFSYGSKPVIENLSFSAERGHITAITGESGSGKSTLFKLILGLYEPNGGKITVNGDISADASLRGLFAYVPQGNMVLSGTVRDNITLCNPDVTDEAVKKATEAAEIYDYIASLPDGFQTVLNERGAGLSEGQIQRISIARALLVNAPILLLDEATSALDEATETRVLTNIKNMTDKTVLFITHRNTSLKVCDRIIHIA